MSRVFMDGFEGGGITLWDASNNSPTASVVQAYTGSYALNIPFGAGDRYVCKYISSINTLYVSFRMRLSSFTYAPTICSFANDAGYQVSFQYDYSGGAPYYIKARLGGRIGTTILGVSTQVFPYNQWVLIEIKVKVHSTQGEVVMKFDRHEVINVTGVNTQFQTTGGITKFYLGSVNVGSTDCASNWYYDDVVLDDADWPGNSRIQGLPATAAGATTQFTPSAGANYQCVDEVPASDTDYNAAGLIDKVDTFTLADLTGNLNVIKCLAVQTRAWKEGNGVAEFLKHVVRPASTDRVGTMNHRLPSVVGSKQTIWENNPEDSQPWEAADVNGMEAGYTSAAIS